MALSITGVHQGKVFYTTRSQDITTMPWGGVMPLETDYGLIIPANTELEGFLRWVYLGEELYDCNEPLGKYNRSFIFRPDGIYYIAFDLSLIKNKTKTVIIPLQRRLKAAPLNTEDLIVMTGGMDSFMSEFIKELIIDNDHDVKKALEYFKAIRKETYLEFGFFPVCQWLEENKNYSFKGLPRVEPLTIKNF